MTDGQTDGQTDGRAIAYSTLSMLSRANYMEFIHHASLGFSFTASHKLSTKTATIIIFMLRDCDQLSDGQLVQGNI